jgi:hypothetical protein
MQFDLRCLGQGSARRQGEIDDEFASIQNGLAQRSLPAQLRRQRRAKLGGELCLSHVHCRMCAVDLGPRLLGGRLRLLHLDLRDILSGLE